MSNPALFLTKSVVVAWAVTTLASCGGGGDGGGVSSGAPTTPVSINATNAQSVAAGTTIAAADTSGVSNQFVLAARVQDDTPKRSAVLSRFMLRQADRVSSAISSNVPQIAASNQTPRNCDVSGNVVIDKSADGTSASLRFNNCSDVAGSATNGVASFTSISSSLGKFSAAVSINLEFFDSGVLVETATGSFTISLVSSTTPPIVTTITMQGPTLETRSGGLIELLSNFTITTTFDSVSLLVTGVVDFTYAATRIGGSVVVTTITNLVTNPGSTYPMSGVLRVVGAGGSNMLVTILGDELAPGDQVRIDIDADNDGIFETTTNTTWAALEAA